MPPIIDMSKLNAVFRDTMGRDAPGYTPPASPKPVDNPYGDKTFTQLLLDDIPSRIRAARAKALGRDFDGARDDLSWVDKFRDRFEPQLVEFTGFQGPHPVGAAVARQSLDLLQNKHMDELEDLMRSPELADKAIRRGVYLRGGGTELADATVAAKNGDSLSAMVISAFASPDLAAEAQASAKPRKMKPGEPEAPSVGFDFSVNEGVKYFKMADPMLSAGLGKDTLDALGDAGRVSLGKTIFSAGDKYTDGALLRIVKGAATDPSVASGSAAAAVAQSTADTVKEAVSAFGAMGNPLRVRTAATMLESMRKVLPGANLSRSRQTVTTVMKQTGDMVDTFANADGVVLDDADTALLSRTLLLRQVDPGKIRGDVDAERMNQVISDYIAFRDNVRTSKSYNAKTDEAGGVGYDALVSLTQDVVRGAAARAIQNRTSVAAEIKGLAAKLAQGFMDLGLEDRQKAEAYAGMYAQVLASGKEFDVATIAEALGQQAPVRDTVQDANRAMLAKMDTYGSVGMDLIGNIAGQMASTNVAATGPRREPGSSPVGMPAAITKAETAPDGTPIDLTAGIRKRVYDRALASVRAANPEAPEEAVAAKATQAVTNSPELELTNSLWSIPSSRIDLFRPGFGDRNATMDEVRRVFGKQASSIAGDTSPAFQRLFENTPVDDLSKKETRAQAIDDIVTVFNSQFGDIASIADQAAVREYATKRVDQMISNLRQYAAEVGTPGKASVSQVVGDITTGDKGDISRRLSQGATAAASVGIVGTNIPARTVVIEGQDLAEGLAQAFAKGVDVPVDQRGFAAKVKNLLLNKASLPPKAPPPKEGEKPTVQDFGIATATIGTSDKVKLAYEGAKELQSILGQPIEDASKRRLVATGMDGLLNAVPAAERVLVSRDILKMARDRKYTADDMINTVAPIVKKYSLMEEARKRAARLEDQGTLMQMRAAASEGDAAFSRETGPNDR